MSDSTSLHIVHTESSCGWGGQEIRILEEARGMQARGHRVSIVCPGESKLYQRADAWGVRAIALPIRKKRLPCLMALRHWLAAQGDIDVINSHSSTDSWLAAIATYTMRGRTPIVRTRHISAPVTSSAPNRWLYARAAKFVVTTGERLRSELINNLGVRPDASASIATGIDTTRFVPSDAVDARRALGLEENARWIGIVATLRSWKGHRFLLDAVKMLNDPDVRLAIVGDGPQRRALEDRVRELGLTERVHFAGNQIDVVPWLQAMDIFALPSYANEGVSQAVMQAMAVGLPIVTTAVGSMTDVVHDRETGLIVPPQDAIRLSEALRRLLNDPALAGRLGQQAHLYAVEHCGIDHMLDRMEAVFRHVVSESRA
ncbi:glycosyltransferase family 4 protein [Uliginosibacterium sp. sgz301328]|uniref:glycosyltransferase family 4 protein n=1 Tax=Uliginosibacterium sp. sgz301328 TaxID=3243764 RepID=UPI00359E04E6